jgi:hypothetical protein
MYTRAYMYMNIYMKTHCPNSLHVWSSKHYVRVGFKLGTVSKQCCLAKLRVFQIVFEL